MLRVLIIVALIFLAAAGFAWLAERPGDLLLTWQGYEIRTSLMVAAILAAILVAAIALIGAIVRAIVRSPQSVGHFFGARRRDRGYRALTRGMIAVGAGDARAARRAAQESRSLLGSEPLVLLLSAQAAQIAGDSAAARTAFETLSSEPDTKVLGLHGLFVEARRQGEHTAARHFAEEAVRAAPRIGWAGAALFEYQSRSGDWEAALNTLAANASIGIVDRAEARRLRAVLLTARATELESGDPDRARAFALEAHKLAPDLVAAATAAARLLARNGDYRRASRVLEATWKLSPHPEIAEAYADIRPGDSRRDRLNRARRLAELRANHPEGALAVARAAIDAGDWQEARNALGGAIRANPTERVCLLMAEIEEGEHGDAGRVRSWLTRALTAPRDPAWTADGRVFDRWAAVSPVSGRVDAFEWRVPTDRILLPPATFETHPEDGSDDAGAAEPPPAAQTVAAPQPPASPPRSGPPAAPVAAIPTSAVMAGSGPKPAAGPRPMARAPDDPGPELPDDEDGVGKLPVFHPGRTA